MIKQEYLKNNTLLIIPNNIKINVLKTISETKSLLNIKIMSLDEVKKHLFFNYDVNSVLYIMDKYNYKYDYVKSILDSLYYIDDVDYKDETLIFLKKIKQELMNNDLLIIDKYFKDFIKNKNIIVYGYSKIDKFSYKFLNNINAEIISREEYEDKKDVFVYETLEEEVENLFVQMSSLVEKGISLNDIKITNVDEKYFYSLKKYSKLFNIPILIEDVSIYSTAIVKRFLSVLKEEKSFSNSLKTINDEFDMKNDNNKKIYEILFDLSNKYNDLDYSFDSVYSLLKNDIKGYKKEIEKLKNCVEIVALENNDFDNKYVFLVGFNQESIPRIYKDEDYINDSLKEQNNLLVDTTKEKNTNSKKSVISSIKTIKNLYISCKKKSIDSDYNISNLVNELGYDIKEGIIDYTKSYSIENKNIKLSKYLDDFIKYGTKNSNLELLYNNSKIDYLSYSNRFTGVDRKYLLEKLKKGLVLSYTSIDSYYHCAFKYYVNNILKIDKFEENFNTIIGNLFHYILSICFKDVFDFDYEYSSYVKELSLTKKERFFIDKLKEELKLSISEVQRLQKETGLDKLLLENKITIDKSSVIPVNFVGIIDKLMYKEKDETLVTIVDYKTGSASIDLDNIIYGLNMQLPIYLYLVKNSGLFKNIKFTGFYLQKVLTGEVNYTVNKTYIEQKKTNLRLEGYSIEEPSVLEVFIPDYENSSFVKSMKTTTNGFSSYSKVINEEQIEELINNVDKKIDEARDLIVSGDFSINPKELDGEKIGCIYCKYKDICFKTNNDYVKLKKD